MIRRRERQREETRHDLAIRALELASERGLANVRVPDIAAAAGVSTRTFNNYFPSKEAAIAWPAMSRATLLADDLIARPTAEPLRDALIAAVTRQGPDAQDRVQPSEWAAKLRPLVAKEPALLGEYLKAFAATEHALARAIAVRTGTSDDELWPKVLAAMVVSAERAAIRHWIRLDDPNVRFDATVREALEQALAGVDRSVLTPTEWTFPCPSTDPRDDRCGAARSRSWSGLHALIHIALAVSLSTSSYVVASRVVDSGTIALGVLGLGAYRRHVSRQQ